MSSSRYSSANGAQGSQDSSPDPFGFAGELHSEITRLRAQLEQARQPASTLPAQVLDILQEYQEHITRAQKFKPTSARGEAVSPLLRAIERIHLLLQERGAEHSHSDS